LQLVTWIMGLEAALVEGDSLVAEGTLATRLQKYVDVTQSIYSDSASVDFPAPPPLTLNKVLDDLVALRNRFVHGLWIPEEWLDRTAYVSVGGEAVNYAETLRHAAAFALRQVILARLQKAKADGD
jgi:hypothetical protein